MYFAKIAGFIPENKFKELEQSFLLLDMEGIPQNIEFKLFQQFNEHEHVQFFSVWKTQEDMESFKLSKSFKFLKGLFKALGVIKEITYGLYEKRDTENSNTTS